MSNQEQAEVEVKVEDTISVDELNAKKDEVASSLTNALHDSAPGGHHERLTERQTMRNFTLTRNRQISGWLDNNLTDADKRLRALFDQLLETVKHLIATKSPEEFHETSIIKHILNGDAISLSWRGDGVLITRIKLGYNPATNRVITAKQTELFARSVMFNNRALFDELLCDGIDLAISKGPKGAKEPSIAKSMIFSVSQNVEIYNTKDATLVKFVVAPSQETSLTPMDVWHTSKPIGLNALLHDMQERKFVSMTREALIEWNRDKSNDVPTSVTDNNPYLRNNRMNETFK